MRNLQRSKGVLTSYSSKSVQIEGYEPLSAEKRSAGVSCGKFRTCKNSCPSGKDFRSCCRKFQSGTGCCRAESLCTCKLSGGHGRKGSVCCSKTEKKIHMPVFLFAAGDAYTVDGNKRKKDTVTDAEKFLKGKKREKR